jgi:hypothetical protein
MTNVPIVRRVLQKIRRHLPREGCKHQVAADGPAPLQVRLFRAQISLMRQDKTDLSASNLGVGATSQTCDGSTASIITCECVAMISCERRLTATARNSLKIKSCKKTCKWASGIDSRSSYDCGADWGLKSCWPNVSSNLTPLTRRFVIES